MKLKTYTAATMAQALAQVRKDLGPKAQIVHTRTYKAGSWFGIGGRAVVEITASSPAPAPRQRPSTTPRREHAPEPIAQPAREPEPAEITIPRRARVSASTRPADDRAALLDDEPRTPHERRPAPRSVSLEPAPTAIDDAPEPDPIERTAFAASWITTTKDTATDAPASDEPEPVSVEPGDTNDSRIEASEPKPAFAAFDTDGDEASDSDDGADNEHATNELRDKLESLERMMSSVLESTRRTDFTLARASGRDPSSSATLSGPLGAFHAQLVENEVPIDLADTFADEVRATLDHDELRDDRAVRHALLGAIERSIPTIGSLAAQDNEPTPEQGTARVVALIGPTGVGKTTSVAKIAAGAKLRAGRRVGLVTSDTYRIGAVEQLKTYADIIDLELRVANNPDEMETSIRALANCDLIVVDTAGRSQHNSDKLSELKDLLAAARPDEIHLVLSSTVSPKVLKSTADKFLELNPDRCVLTKLDECVSTGLLARVDELVGLPISFVTTGQEVPDDLRAARAPRLARAVLDGPGALCSNSDPRATYDPPDPQGPGEES
jgi:flagellar biosynthesis protein FlhF